MLLLILTTRASFSFFLYHSYHIRLLPKHLLFHCPFDFNILADLFQVVFYQSDGSDMFASNIVMSERKRPFVGRTSLRVAH